MKILCSATVLAIVLAVLRGKMNANDAFILVLLVVGTFAV
jgi:hypothetical protein